MCSKFLSFFCKYLFTMINGTLLLQLTRPTSHLSQYCGGGGHGYNSQLKQTIILAYFLSKLNKLFSLLYKTFNKTVCCGHMLHLKLLKNISTYILKQFGTQNHVIIIMFPIMDYVYHSCHQMFVGKTC